MVLSQTSLTGTNGLRLTRVSSCCHHCPRRKNKPGRLKKSRYLSPTKRTGKRTRQVKCTGCGEYGHRTGSWRCAQTGTKKR